MLNTLLGTKKGMTSSYDSRGRRVGSTIIDVGSNFVTQIKSSETNDGYSAIQIGTSTKKSVKKPQLGHLKKAGVEKQLKWIKEIRVVDKKREFDNSLEGVTLGQEVKVSDIFKTGDSIKVTGVSKGRGFAGGVKRHGFHGGPKTHGQSDRHRSPGSIGSGTTPGRVLKGKRMAGHMGMDQVSLLGVEVMSVDKVNGLIVVKGGVPGAIGGLVRLEKQGRIKGYIAPPEPEPEEEELSEDQMKSEGSEDQIKSDETGESEGQNVGESETQADSGQAGMTDEASSDTTDTAEAPISSDVSDSAENEGEQNA